MNGIESPILSYSDPIQFSQVPLLASVIKVSRVSRASRNQNLIGIPNSLSFEVPTEACNNNNCR